MNDQSYDFTVAFKDAGKANERHRGVTPDDVVDRVAEMLKALSERQRLEPADPKKPLMKDRKLVPWPLDPKALVRVIVRAHLPEDHANPFTMPQYEVFVVPVDAEV